MQASFAWPPGARHHRA